MHNAVLKNIQNNYFLNIYIKKSMFFYGINIDSGISGFFKKYKTGDNK